MQGHEASGAGWLLAVEHSALGEAMRQALWLYPAANVVHVLAAGVLMGSILAFDLRLLGFGERLPVPALAGLLLPMAASALAVAVTTGVLLFTADATAVAANPVFPYKLGLIAVGFANVALMHRGPLRSASSWGNRIPATARISALVSLAAWSGTITAGRLIAYY